MVHAGWMIGAGGGSLQVTAMDAHGETHRGDTPGHAQQARKPVACAMQLKQLARAPTRQMYKWLFKFTRRV
jgi:hypothetical protein